LKEFTGYIDMTHVLINLKILPNINVRLSIVAAEAEPTWQTHTASLETFILLLCSTLVISSNICPKCSFTKILYALLVFPIQATCYSFQFSVLKNPTCELPVYREFLVTECPNLLTCVFSVRPHSFLSTFPKHSR
jgi:hypothetical protein